MDMGEKLSSQDGDESSEQNLAKETIGQPPEGAGRDIRTEGGAFIRGNVNVQKGDFIGRDKITEETSYNVAGLPNPYLGLSAFTYTDQAAFGGREANIRQAMTMLTSPGARQTLLFVTGASGCGKSSFAQAGLLPALEIYYQERHMQVARAVFRPLANPLAMLADALRLLGMPELTSQEIERFNPREFIRFLDEHTPKYQVNLAVIDQFEEIFRLSASRQRNILFRFLVSLPTFEKVRTHVLVTLRSDFLNELFHHQALWEIAKQGIELRAMTIEELNIAIQQPMWAAKPKETYQQKRFDPALLTKLSRDASWHPTYLPLLQTTLQELWNRGSLKIGEYKGLADAIRGRADKVYKFEDYEASQPERKRSQADTEAIMGIFLDLVDVSLDDDPRRDVRRRRVKEDLIGHDPRRELLVNELIQARLLSAGREISPRGEVETVDIIHESLIQNWDRLRNDIAKRRQILRQRAYFEQQKKDWLDSGRSDEYRLTGVRLAEARELESRGDIALWDKDAQTLLRRSNEIAEAAQRRRIRNIRFVAIVLALLLLIAIIAAGFALQQTNRAAKERDRAELQAEVSLSRQLAVQAKEILLTQPNLPSRAALLALESMQRYPERQAYEALTDALQTLSNEVSLLNHGDFVRSVAFSPDGEWVVSGGFDGTARVWEAVSGQEVSRMEHGHPVTSVAFSPDGKWVVSGTDSGTILVWEAVSGQEIAHMVHDLAINSIAFSPDGKWVVSAGSDRTARVWEAISGREVSHMDHGDLVSSVAFSPDGKWVISGSWDGTARVWDAFTGLEAARMDHEGWVTSVDFSPDGEWVISGGYDGLARVWEAFSGLEVDNRDHTEWVTSVAFSPDGKRVASADDDGKVWVWEPAGRMVAQMLHKELVSSVGFSPDGKWVVSSSVDVTVRVWEAANGREIRRVSHGGPVNFAAFSPDGKWVVSASDDGTARVWESTGGWEVAQMFHHDEVTSIALSKDGGLLASASKDGTARVWEVNNGSEVARMIHGSPVNSIAFSPDGEWVVSGSEDGVARVWEAKNGKEISRMIHDRPIISVAFSPDSKLVVSGSAYDIIRVWEAASGREITHIGNGESVGAIAISPDGMWVASGTMMGYDEGIVQVWEAYSGKVKISSVVHASFVRTIDFSPNGEWVVSGGDDGTARVWDLDSGNEVAHISHDGAVWAANFSPNGEWVASGSWDDTARVWEAKSGSEIARMTHEGFVTTINFSPDGNWVISGSWDGTARVWEAATGKEVARITYGDYVSSVAFGPDGRLAVSSSRDSSIRVWLWRTEDLVNLACERLGRNLNQEEWQQYIGDRPYRPTCFNLPAGE
jgi:WD40 repeat protein